MEIRPGERCASTKVEGQDGRLLWGTTSSANNDSREPFAWALSSDNKTIIGADTDGYYRITIMSPDRFEKCYAVYDMVLPEHANFLKRDRAAQPVS